MTLLYFNYLENIGKKVNKNNEPIWLSPEELFEKFGIAVSTQAKYRMNKKIPYYKIGSKIFYKLSEIHGWIESAKVN